MNSICEIKFPNGLNSWHMAFFQIVESIGYQLANDKDSYLNELDGQEGKQEFAEQLTTEFETKYKDFSFADSDTTYYDALDEYIDFKIWTLSDNVINVDGGYKTQCSQYAKVFTLGELEKYFKKEYGN